MQNVGYQLTDYGGLDSKLLSHSVRGRNILESIHVYIKKLTESYKPGRSAMLPICHSVSKD